MDTKTIGVGFILIGVVLGTYGLVRHFSKNGENGEHARVKASLTWDDGVTEQTFTDGSIHRAHLLIENPTTETITYHVYLGSDAWASDGPYVAPFWFIVWDPLPTPHYPIVIPPGGSILWENDITMRSTYGQDYGLKEVGVQVLEGIEPELETLIQWKVLDTINLVAA